jgi:3-oxoacyl-[acyl-carrier-protein] synthase-1
MVYFIADNIISSLGFDSLSNFNALKQKQTGIRTVDNRELYHEPFPASLVHSEQLEETFSSTGIKNKHTRAEKLLVCSVSAALRQTNVEPSSGRTGFIFSTTKGNIDMLQPEKKSLFEEDRVLLWKMAREVSRSFSNPNQPLVISNACVSGVVALNTAAGLIENGHYDHMIVSGVDIVSRFVVSGFMSFLSLSPNACKPFDSKRDGLSLGEGAGTIILSNQANTGAKLVYAGGSSANDANHISGPSRTGEGSYTAIQRAFAEAGVEAGMIDHISAHGTATLYNDEMESISISRHGMEGIPVNSFKGNWGHTLGAAGVVETAALLHEMKNNTVVGSAGFEELGVSKPIHVARETKETELQTCLKMASGFGGSNAALVIKKV